MNAESVNLTSFEGWVYVIGILIWLFIWYFANGYEHMRKKKLVLLAFTMCIISLAANAFISFFYNEAVGSTALQESLFSFLDVRTTNIVQGTAGILIIATIIYQSSKRHLPKDFLKFIALAYVFLIGFMSPLIWIPVNKPDWLKKLLAYQTVAYFYGIFLSVGGIIVLIDDLYQASVADIRREKEKKEDEQKEKREQEDEETY